MLSKHIILPVTITLILLSQNSFASSAKTYVYTSTPALNPHHHFYNGVAFLQGATDLFQASQKIDTKALDQMVHCWETAAEDFHAEAAYRLANLYELGMIPASFKSTKISAQDLKKAYAYYCIAADFGHFHRFQSLKCNIGIHKAALFGIMRIQKILHKMRTRVQNNFQHLKINPQSKPQPRPVTFSSPATPLDSEPLKKETSEHLIAQLSKSTELSKTEEKNVISKQEQV